MSPKNLITKKKHLEIALQTIHPHLKPKIHLEQYITPAEIAADVIWNAYALGDIKDRNVVDLGCGTGIFTIAAALLGATESVGVDVDPDAVSLARKQASHMGLGSITRFISTDIRNFNTTADTVIQNPPFGAQKLHKGADRTFMIKSFETAPVVYSFHIKETEIFIKKFFGSLGGSITHRFYYRFPISRTYDFHEKEKMAVEVVVVRVEKRI